MTTSTRPSAATLAAYQSLIGHAAAFAAQSEKLVAVANGLVAGTVSEDVAISYAKAADAIATEAADVLEAQPVNLPTRRPEPIAAIRRPRRRAVTTVVRDEAAAR